jgi:hypothetical protein
MAEVAAGTVNSVVNSHVSSVANPDDPFNEAVATTGLFLIVTAIIAVAFAFASWGMSETLMAMLAGAVAVLSFATSIFCFKAQSAEQQTGDISVA